MLDPARDYFAQAAQLADEADRTGNDRTRLESELAEWTGEMIVGVDLFNKEQGT